MWESDENYGSEMKRAAAHPEFDGLLKRMERRMNLLQPWAGAAYRVTTLRYGDPASILSGEGSFMYGGRWNGIGTFRAVYGSTEDTVAVAESRASAEYAGIPYRKPRLLVSIELSLQLILDLADASTRKLLHIDLNKPGEDWRKLQEENQESYTQAVGRAAFVIGAEGLLVPSAKVPNGINVIYFPENRKPNSVATICEPEELPAPPLH